MQDAYNINTVIHTVTFVLGNYNNYRNITICITYICSLFTNLSKREPEMN